MTIKKTLPDEGQSSDRQLEGEETLDLYLAQMSRSVIALAEQSALLLETLAERLALLPEGEAGRSAQAPAAPAASEGSASEPAKVEAPSKESGGATRQ